MDNVDEIKKLLSLRFETDLFEASLTSLNEKGNKLRYNNFAYSIRELSRHFLHRLAPEENIKTVTGTKLKLRTTNQQGHKE